MSEVTTTTNENVENKEVNTEEAKKSEYTLEVEPIPFEGQFSYWDGSSLQLENIINSLFAGDIAPDYVGCKIIANDPKMFTSIPTMFARDPNNVVNNGKYLLVLRFECKNDKADYDDCNIILRNREKFKSGSNLFLQQMNRTLGTMDSRTSNIRRFTLTERTKQMLYKFLPDRDMSNPRWEERSIEFISRKNTDAGMLSTSAVEIYGLSLSKFLREIYGYKDSDGKRKYAYNMDILRVIRMPNNPVAYDQFNRPINTPMLVEDAEYTIRVTKMDVNAAITDTAAAMHQNEYYTNFLKSKAADPNDKV